MTRPVRALAPLVAAAAIGCGAGPGDGPAADRPDPALDATAGEEATMTFSLTSPAFEPGGEIPRRHTCDGEDLSPPLEWSGGPEDVAAWALIVDDPDAPRGTFVHWVLYDLPGHVDELPEGVGDAARLENLGGTLQGENGFGDLGYGGPCPPPGAPHRYVFRLHALDRSPDLDPGASRDELEAAMEGAVLGTAELIGTYRR